MFTNTKTIYGFTKSRAYGLCGVALATAVMGMSLVGGSVSADEISPVIPAIESVAKPAENATALQPAEVIDLSVNKSPETISTVAANEDLTKAIANVESVGGIVTQDPSMSMGVVSSQEELKVKEAEAQADYTKQANELTKKVEDYKNREAAYNEAIKTAESKNILADKDAKIYLTGEVNKDKQDSVGYYENLKMVIDNPAIKDKNIVSELGYNSDVVVEGDGVIDTRTTDGGFTIRNWKNAENKSVLVKNLGKTLDGSNLNARLYFRNVALANQADDTTELKLGYGNDGSLQVGGIRGILGLGLEFAWLDDKGNEVDLASAFVGSDIDWGQSVAVTYNKSNTKAYAFEGSGLTDENGILISPQDFDANGFATTPAGTYVTLGYGNRLTYSIKEKDSYKTEYNPSWSGWGVELFGRAGSVNIVSKPDPLKLNYHLNSLSKQGSVKVLVRTEDGFVFDADSVKSLPVDSTFDSSKTKENIVEINGRPYRIVEIKGDETGKIELGEKEIIYVVKPQYTTTWITEGGDPLKDPKTGDDTEPNGEFPGYEFVKTVPKSNGDVEHIFKKVEKPVTPTPEEPQKPETPKPTKPVVTPTVNKPEVPQTPAKEVTKPVVQEEIKVLPNTGTAASGLGLMGLVSGLLGLGAIGNRKKDSE